MQTMLALNSQGFHLFLPTVIKGDPSTLLVSKFVVY